MHNIFTLMRDIHCTCSYVAGSHSNQTNTVNGHGLLQSITIKSTTDMIKAITRGKSHLPHVMYSVITKDTGVIITNDLKNKDTGVIITNDLKKQRHWGSYY